MIANRSDYVYVTGDISSTDDLGRYLIVVDGGIMTRRQNPEQLRGEDICFLKECVCARLALCGESRSSELRNFSRKLSLSQISNLGREYNSCSGLHTWVKRGMPVPVEKTASELGISGADSLVFLRALDMIENAVVVETTYRIEKKPVLDMLEGLSKMSRLFYEMSGFESGGGVYRGWDFPFVGTLTPIGPWDAHFTPSTYFVEHFRTGVDDGEGGWTNSGYSFIADKITSGGEGSSTFRFGIPTTALFDDVETFFVVRTHYWRYEPDDGSEEGTKYSTYDDTSILRGPRIAHGQFGDIPVSTLIQAWKTHVEPKFDVNLDPPTQAPDPHGWVDSWGVNMNVRLIAIGLIINVNPKYVEV